MLVALRLQADWQVPLEDMYMCACIHRCAEQGRKAGAMRSAAQTNVKHSRYIGMMIEVNVLSVHYRLVIYVCSCTAQALRCMPGDTPWLCA